MAKVYPSFLNPIKYHPLNPVELPQYISRHIEKYPFIQTIEEWEQEVDYPQLWHKSDTISQQLASEYGPITMQVIDSKGRVKITESFNQVLQDAANPALRIWENDTDLSDLPKGWYFIKLTLGNTEPTILISEPQFVCDRIENSVLLEYYHNEYYQGIYFQTGIRLKQRVLGKVKLKSPASTDTIYIDQILNQTLIDSKPFELYNFSVGGSYGIPDYLIKRLNRVFGCSYTSIDGVQYTKNEGAKWEEKSIQDYPMRGWSIELRETLGGRSGVVYENDALQQRRVSIIATLDTEGFAAGGDQEIQIEDFN